MGVISLPFTFSAGAVIIASQHNSDFNTIYSEFNGSIDNDNIKAAAGIAYSKLTLTGSIVNADINASAAIVGSKLNLASPGAIGSGTPSTGAFSTLKVGSTNQGDILYDNGTSLVRLVPGTSGQFLKTQGSSANPVWATASSSNVLFQYAAQVSQQGSKEGEVIGTSLVPGAVTGNYRFLQTAGASTVVWATKWTKFAGVSTVTVYAQIWQDGTETSGFVATIGGQTGTIAGTGSQTTPEWKSITVDVSGLTNSTVYDVSMTLTLTNANGTKKSYMGNVIAFGS